MYPSSACRLRGQDTTGNMNVSAKVAREANIARDFDEIRIPQEAHQADLLFLPTDPDTKEKFLLVVTFRIQSILTNAANTIECSGHCLLVHHRHDQQHQMLVETSLASPVAFAQRCTQCTM